MKKKIYSTVILLSLAAPALLVAAEENKTEVHGTIELGAQGVSTSGNKAFFQEFRDLDDGFVGGMQLDALKGAYHFEVEAQNPGADDQSFQLKGGEYEKFKYKFNYDEMVHNYTFDAITPFTGIGTKNISYIATPADTATWTKFDYSVDHKSYGGELEISLNSPFYVTLGADKREQNGLRPFSVVTEHTNGAGRKYAEVPEPISNTTDNLHLKTGYLGKAITASLTGYMSSFNNDNKYFTRSDVFAVDTDIDKTNVLAPDNDYRKISGDFSWRDLPLGSVLAASLSHANLQNDFSAADVGWSSAMITTQGVNRSTFEGDIDYTNVSMALSSRPTDKLDTKIYYRYIDRDDKSTVISYGAPTDVTDNAKMLLSYEKNSLGFDLGYRFPNKNKVDAGYEYLSTDRSTAVPAWAGAVINRHDNPESTTDDTFYLGLKNSYLDWLTAKIKYTRLERDSDIDTTAIIAQGADPNRFTARFDTQDKTMDEWKLALEFYPLDSLDLGLNFTHQNNDYEENSSSRTKDDRQSVYADVTWRAVEAVTLNGFIGFEKTSIDANRIADVTVSTVPNRVESTDDTFWSYGLSANIAATDQLSFNFSGQYDNSDGSVDFTDLGYGALENITEFDDYTKKRLEAKAIYAIDPKLKLTLGYLYEKLKYQDYTFSDYTNITGTDYLSGLYADPNYEANVGYVMVSYGF